MTGSRLPVFELEVQADDVIAPIADAKGEDVELRIGSKARLHQVLSDKVKLWIRRATSARRRWTAVSRATLQRRPSRSDSHG